MRSKTLFPSFLRYKSVIIVTISNVFPPQGLGDDRTQGHLRKVLVATLVGLVHGNPLWGDDLGGHVAL